MSDTNFYVYFHRDRDGKVFYVGKGTGARAWSTDRHVAWSRYVSERLHGKYTVEIHNDGLSEAEACELEEGLIAELGQQLVNWINPGRQFDYEALAHFHELRGANRQFVEETRHLEKSDPHNAVERYRTALANMREYESLTLERGLVAELGVGPDWGDPNILDRLTMCLKSLGKFAEAVAEADKYFAEFPSARKLSIGKQVERRIEKLRALRVN